jgi:hypothetical protein
MADVPCSGEGTFRYGLDHFLQAGKGSFSNLSEAQKKILLRGFDLLKAGGRMLYATCTYNPEENESLWHIFLKHRDAEILTIQSPLPFSPGLSGGTRRPYGEGHETCSEILPPFRRLSGILHGQNWQEEDERTFSFTIIWKAASAFPSLIFTTVPCFQHQQSWWILRNRSSTPLPSALKVSMVGMKAFQKVGAFTKPTTRLIQALGPRATKSKHGSERRRTANLS